MNIEINNKIMPRQFYRLGVEHITDEQIYNAKDMSMRDSLETVLEVFTPEEVVELVNLAISNQLEVKENP